MTTTPGSGEFADAAGRYRLDSKIATGGMGVVWRATDTRLNRQVAVKVLKPEYADDPAFRVRFEGEARSAAALHHPNIAGVYDYGAGDPVPGSDHGTSPYLVMELVDGQPLSVLLANARSSGRTLDVDVVQDLMAQAGEALGAAHRAGIVHRDVKPANLLVTSERQLKITDFGIARAADAVALTRTGSVMGTPQYLSPEQARGNASTPASDVYSLGIVAFECLAGRRPFEADTPVATALAHLHNDVPDLPPTVPAPLAAVVKRAMAKSPLERYADGAAFAAALRDPRTSAGVASAPAAVIPPAAAAAAVAAVDEGHTAVLPATGVTGAAAAAPVPSGMRRLDTPDAYSGGNGPEQKPFPWGPVALVLLILIAAIVAAIVLIGSGNDDPGPVRTTPTTSKSASTSPTTTAPTTTPPTEEPTVAVNEEAYIGRDINDVMASLRDLGLNPTQVVETNDGSQTAGLVSALDWQDPLNAGDQVLVHYWGPAPPPSTPTTEPTESDTATDLPTDETSTATDGGLLP